MVRLRHPFPVPFLAACLCATPLGSSLVSRAEAAEAPASSTVEAAPEIPFTRFSLENGLTVILSEDHRLPRVAVNVWYHVGPVNEPKGRSGFAHLFEHLMFEGSKHVGREFDTLMEGMGASNVNGTTNWDRTNYYETVPREHLETALWIESDRMAFMALSAERLEAQRDIVKNERRQSFENAPYGMSDLTLLDTLFPAGHPYHGAVIGSMADLSAATMADVNSFYRTYYAPNNATLTLVGDFESDKAKDTVEKYFATLPARDVPKLSVSLTPPLTAPLDKTVSEDVELSRVTKGWIAPPAYTEADAALRLGVAILTTGKASRLYRELVVDQKIATEVNGYVDSNRLCSIVGLEAKARSGVDAAALESALERSLERFGTAAPAQLELDRARKMLLVELNASLEYLNGSDGESGRAGLLQRFSYYMRDPGYLPRWIETLDKVTPNDVLDAVRRWMPEKASVTVRTLPKPEPKASGKEAS